MKMRKLVAVLMAVMMLCCIIPFNAMAAGSSAKIEFIDKANRTAYSTEQQVWEQNGIIVTNDKGASTSNVGDYANPGRFYKSSTVTIEYPGMTSIVIDCTGLDAKYVDGWSNTTFSANATASVENGIVTITLANEANSFTWETMSAQSRAFSFTVYTNGAAPEAPEVPDEPETPDTPDAPAGDVAVVTEPDVDVAYKFGMIQGNVSATNVYYLKGGMDGYYMATAADVIAAIDVYLENADGGYYMYTLINGTKTYINMVVSGTHVNGAYEAAASTVYTFDAESKTVIAIVNDAEYWFGTRNDKQYTTVGPCAVSYAGFYCQFYAVSEGGETPDTPVVPDEPEIPDTPDIPAGDEVLIPEPEVDVAYKFGMIQGNVSATDVYYLKGGMDGYYMATAADVTAAIDVYLENADGGYYMYTLINGTKTYINMVVSGTHVNGAYEAAASTVYTFDAEAKTVIAIVNDAEYWFGTRNDKQYTTVGPCAVSYAGFYCQFYGIVGGETPDVPPCEHEYDDEYDADCNKCGEIREVPEKPETPDTPDVPGTAGGSADFNTIETPNANGDSKYSNTYTTTNGWVTEFSAIQAGGTTDMNPQFTVIGPDNTYKAVCMNGKVGAAGKITSPTLTGGISKLTVDYTKMFTDTVLSVTVTVTDLATGAVYTHTIAKEADKNTKYEVWTDEWVLDTPIAGDFTIVLENNCPSGASSNKDRMTILAIEWEGAASTPDVPACEHEYDDEYDADCNKCGETREVPEKPIEYVGTIEIGTVQGCVGDTVDVDVTLPKNPGVISAKVKVHFDTTVLEIVGYEAGEFNGTYGWSESLDVAMAKGYFIIDWFNGLGTNSTAELLATLSFEIKEGAAEGMSVLSLEFSCEDNIFNADEQIVYLQAVNGGIEIVTTPVCKHEYFSPCEQYCMICGELTNPDASHNIVHVAAKAPTCGENGNIEHWYCDVCGAAWLNAECNLNTNLRAVVLPATGEHVYDDEYDADCNVCGDTREVPEKPVEVAYGDLDGDGEINNRDLVAIQQYLNSWEITVDEAAADVNGDGEINNRDLVLLQQYLNSWDVTLGK